jgi:hypothetical protein
MNLLRTTTGIDVEALVQRSPAHGGSAVRTPAVTRISATAADGDPPQPLTAADPAADPATDPSPRESHTEPLAHRADRSRGVGNGSLVDGW